MGRKVWNALFGGAKYGAQSVGCKVSKPKYIIFDILYVKFYILYVIFDILYRPIIFYINYEIIDIFYELFNIYYGDI